MKRNEFIRKSLLGAGVLTGSTLLPQVSQAENHSLNGQRGFNHLPFQENHPAPNMVLHKAGSRGFADHGWLKTHHTFSFANYYNPARMQFGALCVLNDDEVEGGMGFPRHPHENMEIVSIPLFGDLEHKDSMGNTQVIKQGDVQVMSAGTGIFHSEYNRNKDKPVRFLQIWILPSKQKVTPRYDQITFDVSRMKNRFMQVLSPFAHDEGVWIHQNAWFHLGQFDKPSVEKYALKSPAQNGVYAFVLEGNVTINGVTLSRRDGLGIQDVKEITLDCPAHSQILLMEIPVKQS